MRTGDESGGIHEAGIIDLERVTRSGLFDVALSTPALARAEGPVLVRPVIDDLVEDAVVPLVDALEPRAGDIIGFTGTNLRPIARLACDAAAWLADRGRSVTVVDACLQRPSISKALPEDGDEGVVDVVNFGVSLDAVRRRTLATRVTLVTAGSYPVAAADVVSSDAFDGMLRECASDGVVCVVLPRDLAELGARAMKAVVVVGSTLSELETGGAALAGAASATSLRRVAVLATGRGPAEGPREPQRVQQESADLVRPQPDEVGTAAVETGGRTERTEPAEPEEGAPERAALEEEHTRPAAEEERVEPEEERARPAPGEERVEPEEERARPAPGEERVEPEEREEEWVEPMEPPPVAPPVVPRRRSAARIAGFVILAAALAFIAYGVWWAATGGGMGWLARDVVEPESVEVAADTPTQEPAAASPTDPDGAPAGEMAATGQPLPGEAGGTEETEAGRVDAVVGNDEGTERTEGREAEAVVSGEQSPAATSVEPVRESAGGMREGARGLLEGPGGRFMVMVSSHRGTVPASRDARAFEEATGIGATIMVKDVGDTGTWHRVTVSGGFPTLTAAREVLDSVKEFGYEGAWIERVATQE